MSKRRWYIVNTVKQSGYKSYLELGVRRPQDTFNHVPVKDKHGVDISPKARATFTMSTDQFFKNLDKGTLNLPKDKKWDVVFIDASHLAGDVKKDILNSLNHLSDDGIIFLHDVSPWPGNRVFGTTEVDSNCQSAWKVIPYFLKFHPEVHLCTVPDGNAGLGVMTKNLSGKRKTLDVNFNPFYEYYIMNEHRKISQNFVPAKLWNKWREAPYYNFNT